MRVFLSIMFLMFFSIVNVYGCEGFADCEKQAKQGVASAQNNLGNIYYFGHGVIQDYSEAEKWFRKAAEQGDSKAQNNLGLMCFLGERCVKDYGESVKWYRKSAEQGNAKAQFRLGGMFYKGRGVIQDFVQAHMLFNVSSANGSDEGRIFRDIVAKDMTPGQIEKAQELAKDWIEKY